MTKNNKDNSGKWSDPTSSYEDAQRIKKFIVKKVKDQKEQDPKEDGKTSSWPTVRHRYPATSGKSYAVNVEQTVEQNLTRNQNPAAWFFVILQWLDRDNVRGLRLSWAPTC